MSLLTNIYSAISSQSIEDIKGKQASAIDASLRVPTLFCAKNILAWSVLSTVIGFAYYLQLLSPGSLGGVSAFSLARLQSAFFTAILFGLFGNGVHLLFAQIFRRRRQKYKEAAEE